MMKLLIGIILAYVLGVTLLGAWHGLGPMEKIWAIAFVAVLASLLIPALRPLAARVLILIVIVFFLVNLYGKAVSAYHAAAGNLRTTASYLALDAWQTGKKWVGSLLPSIGTGTAVDMAERARAADAAYVQCLGNVIAEQAGRGLVSPANRQYANTCLAQASPDEACMRIVLGWIQEMIPRRGSAACRAMSSAGRVQGPARSPMFCALGGCRSRCRTSCVWIDGTARPPRPAQRRRPIPPIGTTRTAPTACSGW